MGQQRLASGGDRRSLGGSMALFGCHGIDTCCTRSSRFVGGGPFFIISFNLSNSFIHLQRLDMSDSPNSTHFNEAVLSNLSISPTRTVAIIKNHALVHRFDIEPRIIEAKFEVRIP